MKVPQFTEAIRSEFPEDYKINWIAYDEENPDERIILDNHHGKNLHWHMIMKKKETFQNEFLWSKPKNYFERKLSPSLVYLLMN